LTIPGQPAAAATAAAAASGAITSEEESGTANLTAADTVTDSGSYSDSNTFNPNTGQRQPEISFSDSSTDHYNWSENGGLTFTTTGADSQTDTGTFTSGDIGVSTSSIGISGSDSNNYTVTENEGVTDDYNSGLNASDTFNDTLDPNAPNVAGSGAVGPFLGATGVAAASPGAYTSETDSGGGTLNSSDSGAENVTTAAVYNVAGGVSTLVSLTGNIKASDNFGSGDSGSNTDKKTGASAYDDTTGSYGDSDSGFGQENIGISGAGRSFTITATEGGQESFDDNAQGGDNFDDPLPASAAQVGPASLSASPGPAANANAAIAAGTGSIQSVVDSGNGSYSTDTGGSVTPTLSETVTVNNGTASIASLSLDIKTDNNYQDGGQGKEEIKVNDPTSPVYDDKKGDYNYGDNGDLKQDLTITGVLVQGKFGGALYSGVCVNSRFFRGVGEGVASQRARWTRESFLAARSQAARVTLTRGR
jgi:hypothetical protein